MYKHIIFVLFLLISLFHMSNMQTKRIIENDYAQAIMAILENSINMKDEIKEFNPIKARNLLNKWCDKNYPNLEYNIIVEEYKRNTKSHLRIDFQLSINPFYSVQRVDSYVIAGKGL